MEIREVEINSESHMGTMVLNNKIIEDSFHVIHFGDRRWQNTKKSRSGLLTLKQVI